MSDTRTLLNRIGAFRKRLEQLPPLVPSEGDAGRIVSDAETLTVTLRKFAGLKTADAAPPVLTNRARGLLEDARGLVSRQRQLSGDSYLNKTDPNDPLGHFHRKTVALTDAALRLVQAFPDAADIQLKLCDGVDAMLAIIRDRLDSMQKALKDQKDLVGRIDRHAKCLADLSAGRMVPLANFAQLAERIIDDARQALPIRFLHVAPLSSQGLPETDPVPPPARYVAAHSITVAQVVARIAPHDYEFAANPLGPVLAALIMDVGMLRVPAAVLAIQGPLDATDRRAIDVHPRVSAEIVRTYLPEAAILADGIAAHHERPDGTGYPNALRGEAMPSLGKLLAVADRYAAMGCDRPHRPAIDPRTVLTDLLIEAEKNKLDRDFAEYLVHLSFHPVGTVVELNDGRVGVVVSNHGGRLNLKTTSRPVVAILTDHTGHVLPKPDHIDLSAAERGSVVRTLGTEERRKLLADWYPELCG